MSKKNAKHKFLVRFKKEKGKKIFVDMQTVDIEYIHEYKEAEVLEEKEGFYVEYIYDEVLKQVVGKYIEIPKSDIEILKEKQEQTEKALQDALLFMSGGMS